MAVESQGIELLQIVALLATGVIAVPLFKRLRLGAVLGYFAGGIIIGPFGVGLFEHPSEALHVAEFGVIMLLFVIGLRMDPSRLKRLRRQIFGLGVAQVMACGALLTAAGTLAGFDWKVAFVAGMGFVLSSTAVVSQMLTERGEMATPAGQKAISILLLEDLAIVPLLAIVAVLGSASAEADGFVHWYAIASATAAVAGLIALGKWGLNPLFRILARARARAEMTAAALLVVLGSSLLMELGGLSMAMGAFLAGVLLSESKFRHQLEADIEPFRGILLGMFFIAIGMSLDFHIIATHWKTILEAVLAFTVLKSIGIYVVARLFGSDHREAAVRVSLFAQGGEFAFVLYAGAVASGIFTADNNAIFTATVIVSMAITPLLAGVTTRLLPVQKPSTDGLETPEGLTGNVLLIGFGRFSQVVSQALLARGMNVSIIELDVEQIQAAAKFGFKVYYGDGTLLNTLRACGAGQADAILVCIDDRKATDRIVSLVKSEFPLAKLCVRSYDRGHAIELIRKGVDYQVRELYESALVFGEEVLKQLGVPAEEAAAIAQDVRERDDSRLQLQVAGDLYSGRDLVRGNVSPKPEPLISLKEAKKAAADAKLAEEGEPAV